MRYDRTGIAVRYLGLALLLHALLSLTPSAVAEEVKRVTLVNLRIDETKIWLPSTIVVRKGERVELTLKNTLTAPHGFKLAAFDIAVEVPSKRTKTVRFIPNEAGIHSYLCQLHAAHIGGQLIVLE